jgi:hypothetical protein
LLRALAWPLDCPFWRQLRIWFVELRSIAVMCAVSVCCFMCSPMRFLYSLQDCFATAHQ